MSDEVCPICGWRESVGHAEICPRHANASTSLNVIGPSDLMKIIAMHAKRDLRQCAAIAAVQGLCAALEYGEGIVAQYIARDAVEIADALIAELEKKSDTCP